MHKKIYEYIKVKEYKEKKILMYKTKTLKYEKKIKPEREFSLYIYI